MKTRGSVLTKDERDILALAALHPHGRFLSDMVIGQHLGMSANRVNTLVHQACIKLGARDRNGAILIALKRGDIKLTEFWLPDELSGLLSSLRPDMLRRVLNIGDPSLEHECLPGKNKQIILKDRIQDGMLRNIEGSDSNRVENKRTVLTKEEREILILSALKQNGKLLSNSEIGQRLGLPVNRVSGLIHRVNVKLGAHSKGKAINIALTQGEVILTDLWSLDELSELFSTLGPDMLRKIANIVSQGPGKWRLLNEVKQTTMIGRRQDGILTNRERDVVILAGLGLINKEIANRLLISRGSVRVFLNRAYAKLGVCKRQDALIFALKQREISLTDVYPLSKLVKFLTPLGANSIEKMAQLLEQKLGQKPITTGSY